MITIRAMFRKAIFKELLPNLAERSSLSVVYLGCVFLAYVAFAAISYEGHAGGGQYVLVYGLTALLVLSGTSIGYEAATTSFRILVRCIISFTLFYIVTSRVEITSALIGQDAVAAFMLNSAWMLAVVCGVIGYFRPSFGLVPLLFLVWQKHQLQNVFALHIEWMDYLTLVETGVFLILGYLIYGVFRRFGVVGETFSVSGRNDDAVHRESGGRLLTIDLLVLFAIALHFGNYLYAGLIKAVLGGNPAFWVLENETQWLVLAAWESNVLPLSFSHALSAGTFETLANVRIFTNFVTIAIQLFAVFAILRIRWALIITLCYDALHLIIFFTTGIFFWKFIILNLAIVAALGAMQIVTVPRQIRMALAAAVVLSPFVFHIMPSFAWLDSRSMNRVQVYAITDDGAEHPVPSNYFLGMSVTFAQNRLVWPAEGAVPTNTWGVSRDRDIMERGLACDWTADDLSERPVPFSVPQVQIAYFIQRYHQQVLSMLDNEGRFNYDLFPHHIFSMPWTSHGFDALDKRRIVAYRYKSETLCLDYKDGRPAPQRQDLGSFDIPV